MLTVVHGVIMSIHSCFVTLHEILEETPEQMFRWLWHIHRKMLTGTCTAKTEASGHSNRSLEDAGMSAGRIPARREWEWHGLINAMSFQFYSLWHVNPEHEMNILEATQVKYHNWIIVSYRWRSLLDYYGQWNYSSWY